MAQPLFDVDPFVPAGPHAAHTGPRPRHSLHRPRLAPAAPELGDLITSAQPAVVFMSLARLCVPVISDACTVQITEDDDVRYRISYPQLPAAPDRTRTGRDPATRVRRCAAAAEYSVRTWIDVAARGEYSGYHGHVTHTWTGSRPGTRDVSRATRLIHEAISVVRHERQT